MYIVYSAMQRIPHLSLNAKLVDLRLKRSRCVHCLKPHTFRW